MTQAEAASRLRRAADYLLETYYEATNTPEHAEEAADIGAAVGLLLVFAQRLDGKPLPAFGRTRYLGLLAKRRGKA